MKKAFLLGIVTVFAIGLVNTASAKTKSIKEPNCNIAPMTDSFDSLRSDMWEPAGTLNYPTAVTNWHIDNGTLLQDTPIDGAVLFYKDRMFSNLETSFDIRQIWQSAGMAFVFWYQDRSNMSSVIAIPGMQLIVIGQVYNGVDTPTYYNGIKNMHDGGDWYNMKAEIDSTAGVVKVYIGDELVVTHTMTTPLRSGKFALETLNAGGWFDNFSLACHTTPTKISECKKGGWKLSNNPTFKNQGDCVVYVLKQKWLDLLKKNR